MNTNLKNKVITALKIHTSNWDVNIDDFISNCCTCPYHTKPLDPTTNGCVYTLLKDALSVLEGEQ